MINFVKLTEETMQDAFGSNIADFQFSGDFYAPEDYRQPSMIFPGYITRFGYKKKLSRKRKKTKKRKN